MLKSSLPITPWYKQFWPWFLIFLPATAVVAGITTFIIAQNNQPELVSSNSYKEGLAININIKLQENAKQLGIKQKVIIGPTTFSLYLTGQNLPPEYIQLKLRHSTISQHDKDLKLIKISEGVFQTPFILPIAGKWYLTIRDPGNTWEISTSQQLAYPPHTLNK